MRALRFWFGIVLLVGLTPAGRAATYVVPDDRDMILAVEAIVIGTVAGNQTRRSANGSIETVTDVVVEEVLKGPEAPLIQVVQVGGRIGHEWVTQAGAPVYIRGERVLLFLNRNARGDWTTYALALGNFRFERDTNGVAILSRGANAIGGWKEDGSRHVERPRLERAFVDYVRAVIRGESHAVDYMAPRLRADAPVPFARSFTSGSYTGRMSGDVDTPIRRIEPTLNVKWRLLGVQAGYDLEDAVDVANEAWNGQSPLIHLERSPEAASDDRVKKDSESRVIANDPHGDAEGHCCPGVIAVAYWHGNNAKHDFNDETFNTIVDADVVVNDGVAPSNLPTEAFRSTMVHEFGHALGLRHSNEDNVLDGTCVRPGMDCCFDDEDDGHCKAIMNGGIHLGLDGALQQWDKDAIDCLYHGTCRAESSCTRPSVFRPPLGRTIPVGGRTILSVVASGSVPLKYQWYSGNTGDTSAPLGASAPELIVEPLITTSYWVRVTNRCDESADSAAAVVTVEPCSDVRITSAYVTNESEGAVLLTAEATGSSLRYRWFRGDTPGSGGTPIGNGNVVATTITERTSFWVSAQNNCSRSAFSERVFASPCGLPSIVAQPADQTIESGATANLSVTLTAIGGTVTWYRGLPDDKTNVVGNGSNVVVGPLAATTTFWGSVANDCGEIPTCGVTVSIGASRRRSVRH